MKRNMGKLDRALRVLLALLFVLLYYTDIVSGTLGIILIILGVVFVLTSVIGFCPLYLPFNINTKEKSNQ